MLTRHHPELIKLALPKGRLQPATACLLTYIGLEFTDYTQTTRVYRLKSTKYPNLTAKMFQEKDIPVQVAVGNYDLGICGSDWVEELLAKFPASAITKVLDLEYGRGNIYLAASSYGNISSLDDLKTAEHNWRLVTEYPNLAETSALNLRLRRFRIFPIWGATEVYPPENADIVVIWTTSDSELRAQNLIPLKTLASTSAFLIANQESLQTKNISQIIAHFSSGLETKHKPWLQIEPALARSYTKLPPELDRDKVWLALPDGHQRTPTAEFLAKAGLKIQGYSENNLNRRPSLNLSWVNAKVVRPQDMPLQVANGNFDLAITGKDWLLDHLYRFPSSPAIALVDLGFGQVRIVAVVSQKLPATTIGDLKQLVQNSQLSPLRVASEYTNIADKYLHEHHVSRYKVIPTWGASEAFLPEDADLLIENTQTGKTLIRHKLKIIDTLFQSTACLIGNRNSLHSSPQREKIASLVELFRRTAQDN
ncbi:MAG TPA: ATP phosphoribosyltransferase [Dehalococcoidia bacterium]|nr:ATP phosphoribosyltransferase [Dehalococcoidia bacterium]